MQKKCFIVFKEKKNTYEKKNVGEKKCTEKKSFFFGLLYQFYIFTE
jgi:hypothetical protein